HPHRRRSATRGGRPRSGPARPRPWLASLLDPHSSRGITGSARRLALFALFSSSRSAAFLKGADFVEGHEGRYWPGAACIARNMNIIAAKAVSARIELAAELEC